MLFGFNYTIEDNNGREHQCFSNPVRVSPDLLRERSSSRMRPGPVMAGSLPPLPMEQPVAGSLPSIPNVQPRASAFSEMGGQTRRRSSPFPYPKKKTP